MKHVRKSEDKAFVYNQRYKLNTLRKKHTKARINSRHLELVPSKILRSEFRVTCEFFNQLAITNMMPRISYSSKELWYNLKFIETREIDFK